VPVQLHLSSDGYSGELLERDPLETDGYVFITTRMVPPGEVTYYFTIGGA